MCIMRAFVFRCVATVEMVSVAPGTGDPATSSKDHFVSPGQGIMASK